MDVAPVDVGAVDVALVDVALVDVMGGVLEADVRLEDEEAVEVAV